MRFIFVIIIFVFSHQLGAAIPHPKTILERTAKHQGSGVYLIEQEVQFPNGQNLLVFRESWVVSGYQQMHLTVRGTQELKDSIQAQVMYNQARLSKDDFWEKLFHMRKGDSLAQQLLKMKVLDPTALIKKPIRNLKDWTPESPKGVRLSRVGGVIAYAFGTPALDSEKNTPGFWIEQDQFVIRKVRTATGVEVLADKYSQNSRGFWFPQTRTVRWDGKEVQIQTISVTAKPRDYFKTIQKLDKRWQGMDHLPAKEIVDSFYSRFR